MPPDPSDAPAARRPAPSGTRQLRAVLWKNWILETRSRRSLLGIGGWGAWLLQVSIPALFFLLMCIPKYYIKPMRHAEVVSSLSPGLESRWWSGPEPYSGPAIG